MLFALMDLLVGLLKGRLSVNLFYSISDDRLISSCLTVFEPRRLNSGVRFGRGRLPLCFKVDVLRVEGAEGVKVLAQLDRLSLILLLRLFLKIVLLRGVLLETDSGWFSHGLTRALVRIWHQFDGTAIPSAAASALAELSGEVQALAAEPK